VLTVLFWYTGLIPDLATLRDRARARWQRRFYGVLALGWRGSARQWTYQQAAYRLTAVLVLPLIVVMQSTVSLEHAVMLPPAWHVNSQPIQFIVTGLLSGLAAVLLTAVLLRRLLGLERFITDDNVSLIAKLFASCALLVAYVYLAWAFMFFLDNEDTRKAAVVRIGGDYAWAFWGSLVLMCLAPQVLWLRRVRASAWGAALVAVAANIGAWLDRYSIMIGGLEYDYLPTPANPYGPTVDEWILLAGTAGLFAAIVLLFARMLPVVSLYEARHEERSR
jgi:formate-dependent nitrite reductase membrane component NrfD